MISLLFFINPQVPYIKLPIITLQVLLTAYKFLKESFFPETQNFFVHH